MSYDEQPDDNSFDEVIRRYAAACTHGDRAGMREGYIKLRGMVTADALPPVECWGCEGRPSGDNDPCDVCGRSSSAAPVPAVTAHALSGLEKLARFGSAMLHAHRGTRACEVGDIDGGTAQDEAIRCGVLEARTVTESCGEDCACTGCFPTECYFVPDDVRAADPDNNTSGVDSTGSVQAPMQAARPDDKTSNAHSGNLAQSATPDAHSEPAPTPKPVPPTSLKGNSP